jgi:two-component system nitrogen regulation response regulator GlnG
VRELQSTLKQAIIQAMGPVLVPDCLSPALRAKATEPTSPVPLDAPDIEAALTRFVVGRLEHGSTDLHGEVLALVERHLVLQVLRHTGGNQSQAARILGLTRKTLRAKLDSLGIAVEHATAVQGEADGGPNVPTRTSSC